MAATGSLYSVTYSQVRVEKVAYQPNLTPRCGQGMELSDPSLHQTVTARIGYFSQLQPIEELVESSPDDTQYCDVRVQSYVAAASGTAISAWQAQVCSSCDKCEDEKFIPRLAVVEPKSGNYKCNAQLQCEAVTDGSFPTF